MTEQEIRLKVADTAVALTGTKEGSAAHAKIVDTYNTVSPLPRGYKLKYTDDWCAGFVSAVGIMTGNEDIMFPECGCGEMIKLYQAAGRWKEDDTYKPQIADVVFYDWQDSGSGDNKGWADHVGIITGINGDKLTVTEGNYADKVKQRQIAVNGRYIRGYGLPDYASKAKEEEQTTEATADVNLPVIRKGSTGGAVKALQVLLINLWAISCGVSGVDGDYGFNTEKAVKRFQTDNGLEVDGVCGPQTWAKVIAG